METTAMQIVSVNAGKAQPLTDGSRSSLTGIYKESVSDAVFISTLGLKGDAVCDKKHHGGVDQAVYLYGEPEYAWWQETLAQPLTPGMFGDNLTLSNFESARFAIGDRLHFDEVSLEITWPRIPCSTLARRMGDSTFVKKFREAERPGVYCRVLREGLVKAGDAVRLEPHSGDRITVLEIYRHNFKPNRDPSTLRRYLAAPIAARLRVALEKQLAKLTSGDSEPFRLS